MARLASLLDIKSLIFSAIHAGLMRRIFRQHKGSMLAIKINLEEERDDTGQLWRVRSNSSFRLGSVYSRSAMGLHRGEGENDELGRCQPSPPVVRITGTGVEFDNRPVRFNQTGSSVNRSARAELVHKWLATGALVPSSRVDPKTT